MKVIPRKNSKITLQYTRYNRMAKNGLGIQNIVEKSYTVIAPIWVNKRGNLLECYRQLTQKL